MSENDLRNKAREYKELKEMMNELKDAMAAIEDDIKAYMGDQEEISVAGVKVRYTHYKASRFDSKSFKEEHPAMYEQYTKTTQARRFSVA